MIESTKVIRGRNFGSRVKEGRVIFNNRLITTVQQWDNERIEFIQPIPRRFGKKTIFIVTKDGRESNKVDFDIKDPREVLKAE